MFHALEEQLLTLVDSIPLEWFVFIASFVEEVVAPIPSPTVMMVSGSLAEAQGYGLLALWGLAIVGAIGKTIGAILVYGIASKLEDVLLTHFGRYFGVTKDDISRFGKKLSGTPRDYLIMTLFRAAPFIPSSVVSVGSGLLGVPMKLYIVSTFLGTIVRDSIYLLAGYFGLQIVKQLLPFFEHTETLVQVLVFIGVTSLLGYWFFRNKKRETLTQ